ncbi:hypothetical protein [Xanthomonas vasicola]|uniref:hypothetical protein n=1 Tax=Xanthomonas vasicola TaxID=56459 RepID=UPI001AD7A548|nr:hypothetical protein [Xanthomonas vasicola]
MRYADADCVALTLVGEITDSTHRRYAEHKRIALIALDFFFVAITLQRSRREERTQPETPDSVAATTNPLVSGKAASHCINIIST